MICTSSVCIRNLLRHWPTSCRLQTPSNSLVCNKCNPDKQNWIVLLIVHFDYELVMLHIWLSVSIFCFGYVWCVSLFLLPLPFERWISPWGSIKCSYRLISSHLITSAMASCRRTLITLMLDVDECAYR